MDVSQRVRCHVVQDDLDLINTHTAMVWITIGQGGYDGYDKRRAHATTYK